MLKILQVQDFVGFEKAPYKQTFFKKTLVLILDPKAIHDLITLAIFILDQNNAGLQPQGIFQSFKNGGPDLFYVKDRNNVLRQPIQNNANIFFLLEQIPVRYPHQKLFGRFIKQQRNQNTKCTLNQRRNGEKSGYNPFAYFRNDSNNSHCHAKQTCKNESFLNNQFDIKKAPLDNQIPRNQRIKNHAVGTKRNHKRQENIVGRKKITATARCGKKSC